MRKGHQVALWLAGATIPLGMALMAAPEYLPFLKDYTNGAEEFFSHMRRAEIGHHHHIAGAYS